ncbi:Mu transposase C-terminal domain-containing protein [Neobacillus notoginsengisoli]|nr:Mu transposase C-terminal domain-containing protein [Neobacillus notoginsengisoli]
MNYIAVNDLFTDENNVYRVLWKDPGNIICYVIEINEKSSLPKKYLIKEIEENLTNEVYRIIQDKSLVQRLSSSPPNEKDLAYRDNAWNHIRELISKEPAIYERQQRGLLIKEAQLKQNKSFNTLIKLLRKYWQRGLVKDCLLPDYHNCGKSGSRVFTKKTGRPRKAENQTGINVDKDILKMFEIAIKKYYLNNIRPSLAFAYRNMIKDNYTKGYYFDDNTKKLVIEDVDKIPSKHQFYYWFKKIFNSEEIIRKRESNSAFERNHRALLGSTEFEMMGPGSLYQIDATPADIFLVNRLNPNWLIGKPTVYFVTDVFSRMITGFHISLRNPSWICMAAALSNTNASKVEFCAQYGINIQDKDWPAKYLPDAIVGDRGELESHFVESLITGLGIDINNNPPHRPDWKGIVEQLFNNSQKKLGPLLPGYLPKHAAERGSGDFRQNATLTLDEYIKVIIHYVLQYNHHHYMDNYNRSEDMIREGVRPIPIELWNWGIKNKSGSLRAFSPEIVNFYLLPRDSATVTANGIKFNKKMLYSCDKAVRENWFSLARKKTWRVKVSYDPRNLNQIFLHENDGSNPYTILTLISHQEDKFKNKTIDEIDQLIEFEEREKSNFKHAKLESEINLIAAVEEIVDNAIKNKEKHKNPSISKTRKIKEVKEQREKERVIRDVEESFVKTIENEPRPEPILNNTGSTGGSKVYSIKDLFKKNKELKNSDG